MKSQMLIVLLLITLSQAENFATRTCERFCNKHNYYDEDGYILDCVKEFSDREYRDELHECAYHCVSVCDDRCYFNEAPLKIKLSCGKKSKVSDPLSSTEITKIVMSVLMFIVGYIALGVGIAVLKKNQSGGNVHTHGEIRSQAVTSSPGVVMEGASDKEQVTLNGDGDGIIKMS